jgi:hypothetical protein
LKIAVLAVLLAGVVSPAIAGGAIPDGTYQCQMDGHLNGEIVILGATYKGPNYDGEFDGTYNFAVSADNITWVGPLGLYNDPTMQHLGSMVVKDDNGRPAIQIHIKLQDSDNVHIADCILE